MMRRAFPCPRRQLRAPRLLRDRRGVTAIEFGLLAFPLMLMICGLFDLGFRQYVAVQLQDALDQSARKVTVGTSVTAAQLKTMVTARIVPVVSTATVTVTPASYDSFTHVAKPEPITTDTAPLGVYNKGDCFLDVNGNGSWDADAGAAGTGGSDDIVYYTAVVRYPSIFPMYGLIGWDGVQTLTRTTMMKNQPYASQPQPATVCS